MKIKLRPFLKHQSGNRPVGLSVRHLTDFCNRQSAGAIAIVESNGMATMTYDNFKIGLDERPDIEEVISLAAALCSLAIVMAEDRGALEGVTKKQVNARLDSLVPQYINMQRLQRRLKGG